jgi:signal transduction histidine kinase
VGRHPYTRHVGALWFAVGSLFGAIVAVTVSVMRSRRKVDDATTRAERAEHALDRQQQELAAELAIRELVLGSLDDGVILWDRHGARVFANDAVRRPFPAVPTTVGSMLPVEFQRVVRRAGAEDTTISAEVEMGPPTKWLRATASPAGDDGSVLLVVRDVTEARRLDAVRRDFVANASHELKTPVASIRATAETLRDGAIDDPPAAIRFTEQLERDAIRLSRIVSDLLDLSRLETGSELAEQVRLDAIASDEAERLEDLAGEAGVRISVHADGVPPVTGAARDLALMVRNLVDNAVRYTPTGGSVDVTVCPAGGDVLLRVSDTGMGVPRRDLPRIFERFYRVDRARSRETGGTGLGLAIVKHVVENHGGSIGVESELGHGTTFEVRLPAATGTSRSDA